MHRPVWVCTSSVGLNLGAATVFMRHVIYFTAAGVVIIDCWLTHTGLMTMITACMPDVTIPLEVLTLTETIEWPLA